MLLLCDDLAGTAGSLSLEQGVDNQRHPSYTAVEAAALDDGGIIHKRQSRSTLPLMPSTEPLEELPDAVVALLITCWHIVLPSERGVSFVSSMRSLKPETAEP